MVHTPRKNRSRQERVRKDCMQRPRGVPIPPGVLHDYQNKGNMRRGFCRSVKRKGIEIAAVASLFELECATHVKSNRGKS